MIRFVRFFITWITVAVALIYGVGRVNDFLTDGFSVGEILSGRAPDARWSSPGDFTLEGEYRYLGKGCQSYVFVSEDGKTVLKFLKGKHFRVSAFSRMFTFIPAVEQYVRKKEEQKQRKLEAILQGWKDSYEQLAEETGILFLHLDGSYKGKLRIRDKMGRLFAFHGKRVDFLVQKRAKMLAPTLLEAKQEESERIISRLVAMLLSEYQKGFGDLDHALLQNSGVIEGKPLHIDVGQIVYDPSFQNPEVYHQQLYDKTFTFRLWLQRHRPEVAPHLEKELAQAMGSEKYAAMRHTLKHQN